MLIRERGGCEVEKELGLRDRNKDVTYKPLLNCSRSWNSHPRVSSSETVIVVNAMMSINITKRDVGICHSLFTIYILFISE